MTDTTLLSSTAHLVTQNALMLSDTYVVVCLPEYFSVRGIGLIETQVGKMMLQVNDNLKRFGAEPVPGPVMRGIIFNRIRTRKGGTIAQENWRRQVSAAYPEVTFANFVAQSDRVAEASLHGPIALSTNKPDKKYGDDLVAVANEFFDKVLSG